MAWISLTQERDKCCPVNKVTKFGFHKIQDMPSLPEKLSASQGGFCSTDLIKIGVHLYQYLAYELPRFHCSHTREVVALNRLSAKYIIVNNFCVMVLGLNIFCIVFGVISLIIEMIISDQLL